jgi:Fic family protein
MFKPKYTITGLLLANITKINSLVSQLNNRRFAKLVLVEFERTAREISTHTSTSIEGNPLSLTDVKRVLKSKTINIRDTEKEVINYNRALEMLDKLLKNEHLELSLKLILDIHQQITLELLPSYNSGALRKRPVIVNDPRTGKVVYLPPDVDKVITLVTELIDFVDKNSVDVNPLILAGIFHKQMVIIHPFTDGNGRTTRLMTKVLLAKMGLDTFNLFSFENYYNQNVTKYFQTVGEYGDYNELVNNIDFTKWLEYFTGGIIDELLRVTKILPDNGNSPETQLEPHHLKILEYIKKNGYITQRDYAKLTDRAKPTRALDFSKLIDLQLIERKGDGRGAHYIFKEK